MRETIKESRIQRQEISNRATVDIKRTGAVKLPEKVQGEIKSSLDDIFDRDQNYFDKKINILVQKTKLSKTEIITLFNESLDRLFLMLYRSVNNDERIFGKIFSPEDIQRHVETLLFDFYRMMLLLVKKNDKISRRKNWQLSKVAQQILGKQLPYLNVSNNVLNNKELIDFFNLSTVIKILSKKGNEAENYLNFCLKLGKEFLEDDNLAEYFYPSIIKAIVIDSGNGAEKYLNHTIETTDKILRENAILNKYFSKKFIGRIVSRRGIKAKDYLEEVSALLGEVNIFLNNVLPRDCDSSATMIKITHLVFSNLKSVSLKTMKKSVSEIKEIFRKIDWTKNYSRIKKGEVELEDIFEKYDVPEYLHGVIESVITENVLTGRNKQ